MSERKDAMGPSFERGLTRDELLKRLAAAPFPRRFPGRRGRCRSARDPEARRDLPAWRLGRLGQRLHRRAEHRDAAGPGTHRHGLGDARRVRLQVQARVQRPRGRALRGAEQGGRLDDPRPRRDRVPQRQDARRRRRHLLAPAADQSEARPLRRRGALVARPEADQDHGQAHRSPVSEAEGRDDPRRARRSTSPASSRSATARTRSARRTRTSAPARTSSRASPRASRASTSATRTTGAPASRTSTRS